MAPKVIHLADLADPEFDGREVIADVVIAGIGDTYGRAKKGPFHLCKRKGTRLSSKWRFGGSGATIGGPPIA